MAPPGFRHGRIAGRTFAILERFVEEHNLSFLAVESGYRLAGDPDTVRGPDVSFVTAARLPDGGEVTGFVQIPSDLAVEVVSPGDTASEVLEKVHDYLAAGVRLIWVVNPETRSVIVFRQGGEGCLLNAEDVLDGGDVLPGFTTLVSALFPSR